MEHNPYAEAFRDALLAEGPNGPKYTPPSTPPERPFWPTSHWVKPDPTLEDFKRLEEKVDALHEEIMQIHEKLMIFTPTGGLTSPLSPRLPRSE